LWVVVVGGGGGGLQDFSVSPRPLGFEFLGFWVWGQGLTIKFSDIMNTNVAKEFALEIVLEKDE